MRQVRIKRMHIENFKGLRLFDIDFDPERTSVVGANGTGKTTLHDAYLWLLTGADSNGRSAFCVQPLDGDSRTIDHLNTAVSCVMTFDGEEHELKRTFEQNWTRKRGTKEDVLCGNTSGYFIDNVPMKAGEYSEAIAKMLCGTDNFTLISSVYAFERLDTKVKRAKLIEMAGTIPDIMNEKGYPRLWKYWQKVEDVDSIRKTVAFKLQGLKDAKDKIPVKITENERDLPEGIDFDAIRNEIAARKGEIEGIDATLQRKADGRNGAFSTVAGLTAQAKDVDAQIDELLSSIRKQRGKVELDAMSEKNKACSRVSEIESKIRIAKNEATMLGSQKINLEGRLQAAREQWKTKNAETFREEVASECPTCHRPFSEEEITSMRNELVKAFNESKTEVMKAIVANGNEIQSQLTSVKSQIEAKNSEIAAMESDLTDARKVLSDAVAKANSIPTVEQAAEASIEYGNLVRRKSEIRQAIAEATPTEGQDEIELRNRKERLSAEVESLLRELAKEDNIAKVAKRRAELEEEDARLSDEIAELDGVLYDIQRYAKARINIVEDMVSSRFKYVRWKMYEPNLTNDGEKEICECLVDGVPVSRNVNQAGRINAGIDIINALSAWLGLSVPLWIDGKESVTSLIDTDAQLITLQMSENQPLRVA